MLRFVLLTLLFIVISRAFWQIVGGIIEAARSSPSARSGASAQAVKLVKDPVCGTFVSPGVALSVTASGGTHYFCSEECREKFNRR